MLIVILFLLIIILLLGVSNYERGKMYNALLQQNDSLRERITNLEFEAHKNASLRRRHSKLRKKQE